MIASNELLAAIDGKEWIILGASPGKPPCIDSRPLQGHVQSDGGLAVLPAGALRAACRADAFVVDVSIDGFAVAVVDPRRGRIGKPRIYDFHGRRIGS